MRPVAPHTPSDERARRTPPSGGPGGRRRLAVRDWGFIALYLVLSAAWILHHPYEPELLYRAMPPHSLALSDHTHLNEHWELALTHPVVNAVAQAFDAGDPSDLGDDPGTLALVWLLSGRLTVGAWVPVTPDPGAGPALLALSHVGGRRAALFRALLAIRWVPGLGRLHSSPAGTLYWRPPRDKAWPGAVVAFAMHRGMLLASWSRDPDAVRTMLWRLEQHQPVAAGFGGDAPWRDGLEANPHRFWISDAWTRRVVPDLQSVSLRVEAMAPGDVRLALSARPRFPVVWPSATAAPGGLLPPFVPGDAPALAAAVSPRRLAAAFPPAGSPWLEMPTRETWQAEHAFFWLTGAPYEGRLLGVAMPALFVALPSAAALEMSAIQAALDVLNARGSLGLTYREEVDASPGETTFRIEASRLRLGGLGSRDAQSGIVAQREGWVTAGTSASSFRRQVRSVGSGGGDAAPWRDWLEQGVQAIDPLLVGWIDPARTAAEILNALAIYRLGQLMTGGRDTARDATLDLLADAATLLEALAPFGPLRVRAYPCPQSAAPAAAPRITLDIRIGDG